MSPQADFEEEAARRNYKAPYSHNHPIPTIQRYREHRQELEERTSQAEEAQRTEEDDSRAKRAYSSVKKIVKNEDKEDPAGSPYPTANRHTNASDRPPAEHDSSLPQVRSDDHEDNGADDEPGEETDGNHGKKELSATEQVAGSSDPKEKRKVMKHNKRGDGGREVTDPVTHLPLVIRDSTTKDLRRAPENEPAPGLRRKIGTGFSTDSKSSGQLEYEEAELQDDFDGMQKMFPPPSFEDTRAELVRTYQLALVVGLGIITVLATSVVLVILVLSSRTRSMPVSKSWWNSSSEADRSNSPFFPLALAIAVAAVLGFLVIYQIQGWLGKKVESIWEDEVWDAARAQEVKSNHQAGHLPESVAWMNSFLASVWPLINPDLFASVIDMLEDVMQASLPKVIRMVSVDDLGQGSEAIRILGIRWLPTGAADKSVDEDGHLKSAGEKKLNDRGAPGEGEQEHDASPEENNQDQPSQKTDEEQKKQKETEESTREGMEAEEGDFVNMEIAFAYRARSSGKSLKSKAKNAHLYLKFYLPGGIFVPVWVELRGIIGTMRVRLQLTPDPPFVSLTTITFLGQPRADISCVPLSKHLPNLMNVPLISSFVQTSIDAALAEYVAPKSLTIDLKDMLVGDDFKKDTVTRGVVVVFIKEAQGFKEGDGGIGPLKGSSDAYVTCSWGKFGKTISSTRVIEKEQNPQWHEWAYLLVSPEELNAEEKLQLKLWDSDKFTADDDLGRVEVDLKELMTSPKTKNQLCEREDRLRAQDPEERMPGTLTWSVGYYEKLRITDQQLAKQTEDKNIRTKEDLRRKVSDTAERKLREATAHDESKETNQQKAQDYQERETALICSAPPDHEYPSGLLSIQIHNITGLEVEALQKKDEETSGDKEDEAEQSDDLPSSYCTIILNHKKIYMTRTKPKNAKPFFNAGIERYVRDWRTCEIMVSVRDNRETENDALLGIVYLPLRKIFHNRSQVMETYPLVGGIGFGRVRLSLVFRSLEMQLPINLIGWDYGTLEVKSPIKAKNNLPEDLTNHRIKLRSNLGNVKMSSAERSWNLKGDNSSGFLPVRKRYSMPLIIEFRKSSFGSKTTPAFAVFWLKDIPDEEEKCLTLPVWKGGKENLKRATTCAGYNGLDKDEQPLGEIEITMRFWRGLSGYHKKFAHSGKGRDMRNVMEVLDTVNDEIQDVDDAYGHFESSDSDSDTEPNETHAAAKAKNPKLKTHTNDSDTSSDSDSDDGESRNPIHKVKNVIQGHNDSDDGSRGVLAQFKDYKDHRKQLHRKHRGIMQWSVMRKADWAVDKVRHGKAKLSGVFEHDDNDGSKIETEV